jgi:hypothetical protein
MIGGAHRARGVFGSVLGHGALLDRASRAISGFIDFGQVVPCRMLRDAVR